MRWLLALSATLLACTPYPGPQPPPPPDAQDAAADSPPVIVVPPPADAGDPCAVAYQHLLTLGCEPVPPVSGTWVAMCRNARLHGLMDLHCINLVSRRDVLGACGVDCQ